MAVTQKEMIYEISVDTKNAVTSIQDVNRVLSNLTDVLSTQVVPGITKTSDSMSGWKAQVVSINQAVELLKKGWQSISAPIAESLRNWEFQEYQLHKLQSTMEIVGKKNIPQLMKSYIDFSSQIQKTTTIGDEQVESLISLGLATRLPNDLMLKMIKTATDLAAVTGENVSSAFYQLQNSMKGEARQLAVLNPELKKLTAEELRNGMAIDILSEKYSGFAEAEAKSFGGALKQLEILSGDLSEEIGRLIVDVFGLNEAIKTKKEIMIGAIKSVDKLRLALIEMKAIIPAIIALIAALGAALLIIKWGAFIAAVNNITLSLYLWATAASATSASMALLTAQVTLVAAGVLTIASAIEQIIKNFDQFKEKISGLGFLKGVKEALIDWDFGTAGKTINSVGNAIDALTGKTKEQTKATDESADATKRSSTAMDKLAGRDYQDSINERKSAMQGLADMIDSLSAKQMESGGAEIDRINAQTMAQQKSLAKKIEETKLVKSINRTELERISIQASQLIEDIKQSSIKDVQKKQLDELIKSNQDLEMSVGSAFQTQYDQSRKILAIENEKLDIKEAQLKAQGLMTAELQNEIDKARLLVSARAEKTGSPETKTYQTMVSAGAKAATAISGVFTKGAAGMMTGAMNIVTMIIQAIMSIADIIPSFLSGLSDAFNKLADLPSVIMSLIPKLGEAVLRFTQEFLPQFLKMLPDMIMTGIEYFLDKIPEAANALMDALPELIDKLLEKLPDIVQKLIETSLKSTGSTVAAAIKLTLMYFTRILPNIVKTIIKDVVPAIINGIVNGVAEAGKSFGKILNMGNIGKAMSGALGKGVKIDTKSFDLNLSKSFKQAASTLTGEASKIFAVQDLTDTMKALSPAEDMANKIEDGLKKGTDYLKMWWDKMLQYLKDVWMWVWNLIKPVFDSLKQIWDMVISLLQTLWNNLQVLWDNVILALQALWDTLEAVWDMVITALQSLWDSLDAIWKGVWTKLSEMWEKLKSIGSDIWDGLTEAIKKAPETFSKLGSSIWKGLSDGLTNAGSGLLSIFNKLNPTGIFSKMFKLPDSAKGQGTVEKALNIDIPFLSFAKGGEVPGNAPVSGDSSMNDRILALVSPGEAIIPRSKMNQPEIKSIIDAILTGKFSPQSYFKGSMKIGGHQIGISENGIEVDEVVVAPINPIKALEDSTEKMWEMVKDKTFGMVMKMFESNKFHNGGLVPSFANGGEVPAMLQSGEFVVNRRATSSLGTNFLDRINGQSSSNARTQQPIINLTIDIKTTEPIDDAFFRQKVLPRVRDEIKRSSLNGEFVISAKGIR